MRYQKDSEDPGLTLPILLTKCTNCTIAKIVKVVYALLVWGHQFPLLRLLARGRQNPTGWPRALTDSSQESSEFYLCVWHRLVYPIPNLGFLLSFPLKEIGFFSCFFSKYLLLALPVPLPPLLLSASCNGAGFPVLTAMRITYAVATHRPFCIPLSQLHFVCHIWNPKYNLLMLLMICLPQMGT